MLERKDIDAKEMIVWHKEVGDEEVVDVGFFWWIVVDVK